MTSNQNNLLNFYTPNGKPNPVGSFATILTAIISGGILGAVYSAAAHYIPFIYVVFIATFCSALGIGWISSKVAKLTVLQKKGDLALAALLGATTAVYFNWVTWVYLMSEGHFFTLNPKVILTVMQEVAVTGAWSIKGATPTGWVLYSFWLVETLILFVTPLFAIFSHLNSPYCEPCKKWLDLSHKIPHLAPISNPLEFTQNLQNHGASYIENLPRSGDYKLFYSELELIDCPCCKANSFARLNNVKVSTDDKGEESTTNETIVDLFHISQDECAFLREKLSAANTQAVG